MQMQPNILRPKEPNTSWQAEQTPEEIQISIKYKKYKPKKIKQFSHRQQQ